MADFTPDSKSLIHGLSDFWLFFFKEIDQVETMYQGAEIQVGQAYLDLMALLLNVSVQDAVVFNKEYFKSLVIAEDDLVFRQGSTASSDVYRLTLPDNMVDGRYLNNKILVPTEALERDVDYLTNSDAQAFDFMFDVTNAYYEYTFGELHSAFRVRAKLRGSAGGSITLALVDDGTTPLSITRTGYTVSIAYDGPANGNTTTTAQIVQALNLQEDTQGLLRVELAGIGAGEGSPAAVTATPLARVSANPLDGFASRQIQKSYGGSLAMGGVTDWLAEGVEKGDVLRIISGAGLGIPAEYDIRLVRAGALYLDAANPLTAASDAVDFAVLREPLNATSTNEPFSPSGISTQNGADGVLVSASGEFQSPTLALSPVHVGELIEITGASNNGVLSILGVPTANTAFVGGFVIADEAALFWSLVSVIDPTNIGVDGGLTNAGDGTGTFTALTATFTAASVGTVLRLSRGGLRENYDIVEYTNSTTITLALEDNVSDGSGLDWGWARFRTPIHQVVYSPPVAWPKDSAVQVRARRAVDGRAVVEDIDYTIHLDTGRVIPQTVWAAAVTNTVTYDYRLAVKHNHTAQQSGVDGTITPATPNTFTAPTGAFSAEHAGFAIRITGSGENNDGLHIIESVTSATSVELRAGKVVSSIADTNNGTLGWALLGRGVAVAEDVVQSVVQMSMWAPDALVDQYNLYHSFGYLIDKFDRSSPEYRSFIRGIFQLFMLGPTLERFESAVNTVAGLEVIRDDGELLLAYDAGHTQSGTDGTYNYLARTFTAPSALFTSADAGSYIYAVDGPNHKRLLRIAAVLSTTEVILEEEVTTGGPYAWELTTTGEQKVTTSRTIYVYPRSLPVRAAIIDPSNLGLLTFRAFEVLTDVFTVTDYLEDPDWWEHVLIPSELQPLATVARRQSTPRLFENVTGAADGGCIGDPGFIIGADSEGFVPTPALIRSDGGAANGAWVPDIHQPFSTLNTYFDSATAAFTPADMGRQVTADGYTLRITEIVSATRVRVVTFTQVVAGTGLPWELHTLPLPKRNKAAFVILDKYLKHHLFTVSFDSYLLSLLRADFFSDLQDLVFKAKPTHTYIILQPSALFEEAISLAEGFTYSSTLGLGGDAGLVVPANTNELLIGTGWLISSWFRNINNVSSFVAPLLLVPDVLGASDANYAHHLNIFDFDRTTLLSNGVPIQRAPLITRATADVGVDAEVTLDGVNATITFNDVGAVSRDSMLMMYITLSGSGSGNDGTYRIGGVGASNSVRVFAAGGLTFEAGLTWSIHATGTAQGRVYLDTEGRSFFEEGTSSRAFTSGDIGTFVRNPFPCDTRNTYRIHAMTADPYVVRVAVVHQTDPVAPANVQVTLTGLDTVITLDNPGDIVFTQDMASVNRGNRVQEFYAVFPSGPNAGERRLVQNWISTSSVRLEGAVLLAAVAADVYIERETHYTEEVVCGDWEHVEQQIVLNEADVDLSAAPVQDSDTVTYTAEGVREPIDPGIATFDASSGDTMYSVGMTDPRATGSREATSRDMTVTDNPLMITVTP